MLFALALFPPPFPVLAQTQTWGWDDGTTPFVVSPDAVVERMLYLAQPKSGERLRTYRGNY